MRVTVFREIPPAVIGTCGVVPNHEFDALEERLDAVEASGDVVERYEPAHAADTIAAIPEVRRLVAAEREGCFPIVLIDGDIVTSGRYPTRTEWAHAIGAARRNHSSRIALEMTYEVSRG